MNSTLDLNLLLFARHGGEDLTELPDLYAAAAPRRAAHGRETDSLVIYVSLVGNAPLSPQDHARLLQDLANKFYKTSGSLTAALRTIAEALNLHLLDRNLRNTGAGRQGIGQLILVALRGDNLYIAQSGAVQAYLVTPSQTQPIYDLQTSGRGLGLSRSTPVRFLQIKMAAGDYLLLSTIPPADWPGIQMSYPGQQGIDILLRQLGANAGDEFNAVVVQAQTGTGKLKLLKRKPGAPSTAIPEQEAARPVIPPAVEPAAAPSMEQPPAVIPDSMPEPALLETVPAEDGAADSAGATSEIGPPTREPIPAVEVPLSAQVPSPSAPIVTTAAVAKPSSTPAPAETTASSAPAAGAVKTVTAAAVAASAARPTSGSMPPAGSPGGQANAAKPTGKPVQPPVQKAASSGPPPGSKQVKALRAFLAPILASILGALRSAFGTIGAALLRLLKNLLPDADVLHLPASTMVFIAIAIPLVLAVLGGVVFLQRGQAQEHQVYYQQAVEKADYAATLTNPLEQRLALQTALGELDTAEEYSVTSQSQALRYQVTSKLDALDAVKRLDYKQAVVNGLESAVKVTRIVASAGDLYLLDGNTGSVLHAVMTNRGYELDPTFKCGPTQGYITVGPLIDIAELPPGGMENASLLAMDANGNLLYCVVGGQPYSATLAPPNTGMGTLVGMSLDRGDLYVLDPSMNAVWVYRNMDVSQPHFFFGEEVPPMQDVTDLEVYNDELYMLHADGHTTKCTYSGMAQSPTRCEDPYPYTDNRPGRVHGPVIEDTTFTQMDYITFPERSIFYLDAPHQAIYYFSVLLTLQHQYQPKSPLAEGDATAFAISANRIAFLAVGNNVYYAAIP